MTPQSADSTASVSGVGQASSGPIRLPPKPPTPPLVMLDRSLAGGGLQCPVPVWTGLYLCPYPPIPLLERTLIKIREDQAEEAIALTLRWPRRSWFHLLQMACEIPLLLPRRRDLMSQHLLDKAVLYHTNLETLQLTAWTNPPGRVISEATLEESSQPTVTPLEGIQ